MSSSLKHNLQSMRKFKDKSHEWITSKSDAITIKLERLMIMCNGYNKIQPVRLSRGVTTMVSDASLFAPQGQANQCQFRPCLGSRRSRKGATAPRHDVVRKPNKEDKESAASTRITFSTSTDKLHWGSDLSHHKQPHIRPSPQVESINSKPLSKQPQNIRQTSNIQRNDVRFCCDCGCMIEEINRAFKVVEQKAAHPRRQRNRMLARQYSAPAKCR